MTRLAIARRYYTLLRRQGRPRWWALRRVAGFWWRMA